MVILESDSVSPAEIPTRHALDAVFYTAYLRRLAFFLGGYDD
jgi:hypothetical protein